MDLIISPKDNINKLTLKDIDSFCLEGETLLVVYNNGQTRNYPLIHIWYYESKISATCNNHIQQETEDIKVGDMIVRRATRNTCCNCGTHYT